MSICSRNIFHYWPRLGAQIIDLMLLVIDVTKGVQTQTAECLIIGEITCDRMLVVLNKIDLIEEAQRSATIEKVKLSSQTKEKFSFVQLNNLSCSDDQTSTKNIRNNKISSSFDYSVFSIIIVESK